MTENQPDSTLFLVDSFAQIFRCHYALRALTDSQGRPTNAVFGMARFLIQLEQKHPRCDGAFVFDRGRPPHRMKLAPAYKANRPPTPEDLLAQLPAIRAFIAAFGWTIVEHDDTEADDLIASIAAQFTDRQVRIVSADKDLAQTIDGRVEMLVPDPAGKGFARRGVEEVRAKFGVGPENIRDYLALIGDASDNIPGVPGVGPKTAAALLVRFGSAENAIARANEIERESLRAKIAASAELIRTNIELVALVTAPPDGQLWKAADFRRAAPDFDRIGALIDETELRSLKKDLAALRAAEPGPEPGPEKTSPDMEQLSLF